MRLGDLQSSIKQRRVGRGRGDEAKSTTRRDVDDSTAGLDDGTTTRPDRTRHAIDLVRLDGTREGGSDSTKVDPRQQDVCRRLDKTEFEFTRTRLDILDLTT